MTNAVIRETASTASPSEGLPRVVVAAMGSEYRRDDGAGLAAMVMVAEQCPDVFVGGPLCDPLDLLGMWDGADLAVIIDAVSSGAPPGTVHLVELEPALSRPPGDQRSVGPNSTHGIGLAGVYRLARAIGRAPAKVVVVGIEGLDFGQGVGLNAAVREGVTHATRHVVELIGEVGRCA